MSLRRATPRQFAADPIGRFVIGSGYLLWCATRELGGSALWSGPLTEEHLRDAFALFDRRHDAMADSIDLLTDGRRVIEMQPVAYQLITEYFAARWAAHAARVRRHAVIAPTGVLGAVMSGTYLRNDAEHRIRVFDEPQSAFAWLDAGELLPQLEAVATEMTGVSPLVVDLRSYVEQRLADATIQGAAQALNASVRSLQRQLGQLGTSFRNELDHARIRAAKRYLRDSDDKLDAIAARVGCASGSHLNAVFRRVTGQPPGKYRR